MLRKLGTGLARVGVVGVAVCIAAWIWTGWVPEVFGQSGGGTTHVVLTNDQHFTVDNSKYLSGIYECSDGGYIDSSCIIGHFPPVSCPAGYAIQVISADISPATCVAVGTGTPAGSDTYVQYNASGVFGADQNFTWNYVSSILHLGGAGPGEATFGGDVLANLGTPSNGTVAYCSNCTINTSPCTTGGTGSMAERVNGAWVCFGSGSGISQAYTTVQDEGSNLTQRSTLNFTGGGVTCVDNGGSTRTDCTIPVTSTYLWIAAGSCQSGTGGSLMDLPSSNPAVASCTAGTNTLQGTLDFADGANTLSTQTTLQLAPNWNSSGSTDVIIRWFSTTTSGNVVWQVATACVATTETNDPSFNTASTVTSATQGTASRMNSATITGLTMTGCAAGEVLHLKVFRDPTNGSDTMAGTAQLVGLLMTFPKS